MAAKHDAVINELNFKIDKLNKHNHKANGKAYYYCCLCILLAEPYNTLSKPACCTNYAYEYKVRNSKKNLA